VITHTAETKLRRTIRWLSLREQTTSWRVRNRLLRPLLLPLYNKRLGCKITDRLGLRKRAFARAYRNGAWTGTSESLSGLGSGLGATEALRAALPDALRQLNVRVLLDVPCGDWHWISHVVLPIDRYIGGDIVASVVDRNRTRFADGRHEFRVLDLWNDPLPTADLLLCRDALVHFSNADIWRALNNIVSSDITFLATGHAWPPPITYVSFWQDPLANLAIVFLPAITVYPAATTAMVGRLSTDNAAVATGLQSSLDVLTDAGAAPGTCGPAVPVVLTLNGKRASRLAVRTRAAAAGRSDADVVRLTCQTAP